MLDAAGVEKGADNMKKRVIAFLLTTALAIQCGSAMAASPALESPVSVRSWWHDHTLMTDLYPAEVVTRYATGENSEGYYEEYCTDCDYEYDEIIPSVDYLYLSYKSCIYNGKTRTPSVTVVDEYGDYVSKSNYDVIYPSGRKNVGQYKVKVRFKNYYTGTVWIPFAIYPRTVQTTKLTPVSKGFKVYWKKQSTQTSGFQIDFAQKKYSSHSKTITVRNNRATSATVKKLAPGKKYYVMVRAFKYVNGRNYYGEWSKPKTVVTKR